MKIGFIGAGNLATALVAGASKTNFFKENFFYAYDVFAQSLENIASFGVKPCTSVAELIGNSDTVILAVKPKDIPALLKGYAEGR